jgi:outer membrane protein assembly factor BamB
VSFPLATDVSGDIVTVAGSDGTVIAIDARAGRETWRASVGATLAAGVGSDGSLAAVVTTNNELVAIEGGKVLWKQKLSAQAFTAPLVAGRRVFVQTADRSISAWDGQSGRRLWLQQRTGENLVLRKSGVLIAVGDTLVRASAAAWSASTRPTAPRAGKRPLPHRAAPTTWSAWST